MSSSVQLKPPVGGWDTRESLADMPPENAIVMKNWFPSADKVTLRRGSDDHVTGLPARVDSLLEYVADDGDSELFAASDGGIYDVTTAGTAGAAEKSGFTSNRWQHTMMNATGGNFLFACNGQDTPQTYNGTSFADTTITGPTVTNLVWCNVHQSRLWVGEIDKLEAWYGGVGSIGGAFTKLTFYGIAKLGGYIAAMGSWTRDAGDGADDVAVFLTSEGEALIYQGGTPGSDFALVGVFRIGKPIGRRCMIKAGADLIMVTQDGFVSAATILSLDRSQVDKAAISGQITRAVNDAVRDYGSNFGWQPFIYPKATWLVFNIPTSSSTAEQYVFNTITGAPCQFTGMNAICWSLMGDDAYFGTSDGRVVLADFGSSDNGTNIVGDCQQAFNDFRSSARDKHFKRVECIFESNGDPQAAIDMNVDYKIIENVATPGITPTASALWGIALWGIGLWGTAKQIFRGWRVVRGHGRVGGVRVRVDTSTTRPSWIATNVTWINGGQL